MKRFLLFSFLFIIIIFTSSCARSVDDQKIDNFISNTMAKNSSSNEKGFDHNKKTIVFISKVKGDHFLENVASSAKKVCENAGYNFIIDSPKDPKENVNEQIKLIEEYTASKVDGIMIVPADDTSTIPALEDAQKNKIPVLNVDKLINDSVDNKEKTYEAVKYAVSDVKSKSNALVITGTLASGNARERRDGGIDALKENGNINIVDTAEGNWSKELGYSISKEEFSKHPDINIVVCGNDDTALGVIQYIKENKIQNVIVTGFDDTDEAKKDIKDGTLKATIDQNAVSMGRKSGLTIINLINGKKAPNIAVNVPIINKSNVDD